jgi:hypothetical protein
MNKMLIILESLLQMRKKNEIKLNDDKDKATNAK